jgi:hypothetical protein
VDDKSSRRHECREGATPSGAVARRVGVLAELLQLVVAALSKTQ